MTSGRWPIRKASLQVEEPYQSIGAEAVWNELGGPVTTGEGIVVADLDTGIWPEHPMFDDLGLAAPPAPPSGTRACEFGLSGETHDAPFTCDDKLIGAQAFLDTYTTFIGAEPGEYCDTVGPAPNVTCSARDADGHGTHTLTTAAGNFVTEAEMWGGRLGSDLWHGSRGTRDRLSGLPGSGLLLVRQRRSATGSSRM